MNHINQLLEMRQHTGGLYWAERILSEAGYAIKLSENNDGKFDALLASAIGKLYEGYRENGAITKDLVLQIEEMLMPISETAKAITIYNVSHAHIDMNWLWGNPETVSLTIDTFRTMLKLMEEYPDFIFSQSQASTYRIVEQYYPEMLPEIRRRVKEGRWEVNASTWVEGEKNMANGESLARHYLYTKKYLSKLLDIPEESLEVDFEPDTFGHNQNMPEILTKAGVKYYYHCRGNDYEYVYNWRSPSGETVLVFREPNWYGCEIEFDLFEKIPNYCKKYQMPIWMNVYGVGDHGGGPTRRDLERLHDMQKWPIMATLKFSTMRGFFKELEKYRKNFPVIEEEQNFLFMGCYTSQSRIKMSNRIAEDTLYDAEALCAFAEDLAPMAGPNERFQKAWRETLFNQFHDIMPGSGRTECREYALGHFQDAVSYAMPNASMSMNLLASTIDTSGIAMVPEKDSRSEGGGVGFNTSFLTSGVTNTDITYFPQTERGNGDVRLYTFFNMTQYHRKEVMELVIWDWTADASYLRIETEDGKEVKFHVMGEVPNQYGHALIRLAVEVEAKPFGYTTLIVSKLDKPILPEKEIFGQRREYFNDGPIVMENEVVKATFEAKSMKLISFVIKKSNKELIKKPSCFFQYILESAVHGMAAWTEGVHMLEEDINEAYPVDIRETQLSGVKQWVRYQILFKQSKLDVIVYLEEHTSRLRFFVTTDWLEVGCDKGMPQLRFAMPFGYEAETFRTDVPFGVIDRGPIAHDVPVNSFMCAVPKKAKDGALLLTSDASYAFRGYDGMVSANLIRSSYDPDAYPELGIHRLNIGVAALAEAETGEMCKEAFCFAHPIHPVSNTSHGGSRPMSGSFLNVDGNVRVSAVKVSEDNAGMILRLYSITDSTEKVKLTFDRAVKNAVLTDVIENEADALTKDGAQVSLSVPKGSVQTVKVTF